ncbi:GTP-binding protein Rho1 [Nowakowskiella sp. JEL0407]|nr:GTP-binding protein Rho1 [Nowakowskiella sp. JEL0407]
MDGVGMRIALLAFVPGYYEYSFPGVPNFIQPQNLIPQFPSTSAEWQPAAINIERSTSSPSLNGGRNSPVPSTAREHICNWTAPSQPVCGIICDSGKALLSHIDQKHIGYSKTNDLCLKCFWPGCNYEAEKKRHHIISHLKVHVRDADFECEICGRRYKRSNELNFHKKAHHANFLTRTLSKNRRLSVEAGISSADLPENLDSNSKLSMEMALRNNSTVAIPAHQANDIIQQLLSESAISPQLIYKNSFESSLNPNWIFGNGNIGIDYSSQLPDPLHEHVQEETNNIDQYFDMAKFESSSMEPSNEFYGENTFALLHQKRSHQRPPPEILSSLAVAPAVLLKLVVVGDPGSGKTSLVRRMDNDVYNPSDIPQVWEKCTIERLRHNKNVEIEMVDTTSEQNYNRFRVLSYTNSDAVILTFSIVYPESLENVVDKWAGEVRHFCGSTPIFLVGCKVDLRENILDPNNVVSKEKGFEYAQRIGASAYFEVSSKSGEGINDLVSGFENVKKRSPIADGRRAKQKCSIL